MARPQEEQKRAFSEVTTPHPGQVTMRTDCTVPRRGGTGCVPQLRLTPLGKLTGCFNATGNRNAAVFGFVSGTNVSGAPSGIR
jgi:hypothetical protein